MVTIRAKERYEVAGKTILFIPEHYMTDEQMEAITNQDKINISFKNENSGEHERYIHPSIMVSTEIKKIPSGYYVTVELDAQSLPVSRREIDGAKY